MLESSIDIRNRNIIEKLKQNGYTNRSITYEEFKILYEPYKQEMSEKEFAGILGVTASSYNSMKYKKIKRKILKEKTNEISEERKEEIRNTLKKQGYTNKLITYEELKKLYEPYKEEITEREFAEILGIFYSNYHSSKFRGTKLKILKEKSNEISQERKEEKPEISQEREKEIIAELKKQGYTNKLITYKEFQILYEPYKEEMTEREFAVILGISYSNYKSSKYNGTKLKILKEEKPKISQERKEEIINALKKQGYTNKLITYEELKELHEPYKEEMTEREFARILGILDANYNSSKYDGTKLKILKEEKPEISQEREEEIITELKKQGYTNKLIIYKEFQILYGSYKEEMTEREFADILGISYSNYKHLRSGQRAKILKENTKQKKKVEISEVKKNEIRQILIEQGYENKTIDYNTFKELYEPYKQEMTEREFASILGIFDCIYKNLRYRNTKVKINFRRDSFDRVKYKLKSVSREYTREELEEICKENNVTLYDVLVYMYGKKSYIDILMKRDRIYIGKCEIPRDFSEKYAKNLLDIAKLNSKRLTRKYNMTNLSDDLASDSIIYILQNKGNLVKNSNNDEMALELIGGYLYVYIKYQCITHLKVKKPISLDASIDDKELSNSTRSKTLYTKVKDKNVNIEEETQRKEDMARKEDSIIVARMKSCYDMGMGNTEAIEVVTKEFHISKEELLQILEKELSKRRKIIRTKSGKVYLGDEK